MLYVICNNKTIRNTKQVLNHKGTPPPKNYQEKLMMQSWIIIEKVHCHVIFGTFLAKRQKQLLSVYGPLTSHKITEKTNELNHRKVCYGRMDGGEFPGPCQHKNKHTISSSISWTLMEI